MTKSYTFCEDTISDLFKDVYGSRPGEGFWTRWHTATEDEKQAEWDWLISALDRVIAEQKQETERNIVRFGKRIQEVIDSGAKDRETALRWIMEADQCNGDWDYLCYCNGLPYNFFKKAA